MTYQRILVAVDDSPAGLDAVRATIDLAGAQGAIIRAVTVVRDHALAGALGGPPADAEERLAAGGRSVLAWVTELATAANVPCETVARDGEPFRRILEEADTWEADLIVMGRSDRRGPSSPYVGSETAQVLEFTRRPVLVVPRGPRGDDGA
jgi:nucleotide-binding universal stress UspA family protein